LSRNRLTDVSEVVSPTRRPPFTPHQDSWYSFLLRPVHITRARARQACARRETRLAFTCARIFVVHTTSVARATRIACLVTCHIVHITREHSESHEH
jgi:hypothetical protein